MSDEEQGSTRHRGFNCQGKRRGPRRKPTNSEWESDDSSEGEEAYEISCAQTVGLRALIGE